MQVLVKHIMSTVVDIRVKCQQDADSKGSTNSMLKKMKERADYFSEKPTQDQRGSNPGRMHDWRGSQVLYQTKAPRPLLSRNEVSISCQ